MEKVDLIIHAEKIFPILPEDVLLEKHTLIIKNGLIHDILPSTEIDALYTADKILHRKHHLLMPGFANTHTHTPMNLLRGSADDLSLMDWLQNYIWPSEQKWMSNEFIYEGSTLAIAEMIKNGTTFINDMYFFPNMIAQAAKDTGIRAAVGIFTIEFASAWANNANEYIEKGLTVKAAFKDCEHISFTMAPHSPYAVSEATLRKCKELADDLHMPIHIHVHETADEIKQVLESQQMRPLAYLHKLGLTGPNVLAVHMTQLNKDDIALVKETGTHIAHCPISNMKLASGICPVETLNKQGINVALGTDGAASNNSLDMFKEMRTAALLAKISTQDPRSLPAKKVLQMATINGAHALGLQHKIGSLEKGKAADFIALDLDQLDMLPFYNVNSQLAYSADSASVSDVWVAGKQLLDNRKLTTIDEEKLLATTKAWRKKIMGTSFR